MVESGPVRVRQQLVEADLVAALPLVQQVLADDDVVSGDGDEVSGNESEGNSFVSSSGDSESGKEEAGVLEELQGRGSSQAFVAAGSLADHLFDEMPQSVQGPGECFLGGATSVGTSSRSPHGAALELVGGEPKGKAKFAEVGTESVVSGGRNSALDKGCPSVPGVLLGAGGNGRFQERDKGAALMAPWVNLFGDNRNLGAGIKLDEWEVDGDLVMLEDNDVDVVEEAWGYCLVGLFAGKCPGWTAVRKLREGWKVNCSHWRHRSGWFVFKFQSEEDRRKVLEGGPYFAYGCNLILKSMPRCFRFEGEDVSSVPIWIKLPGLPLDCWNARALGKIVSKVGKPISTDKLTLSKERISFARVLVEVDASKDIISEVEVRLPTGEVYHQLVIPELIPKFCKRCKSFGHVEGGCGKGLEGRKSKVSDDSKKRTGGGSEVCPGANSEGSGPLNEVPHFQEASAVGSGDILDGLGAKGIQNWIMTAPKVIQEVYRSTKNEVRGPERDRAKAVICAIAGALSFGLEIEDPEDWGVGGADLLPDNSELAAAPSAVDPAVGGAGGGENLEDVDEDSPDDLECDDGGFPDVGVADPGATPMKDLPCAGGRNSGEGRPQLLVAPVPATSLPMGGLEIDAMGWSTVGKKGRRKKR